MLREQGALDLLPTVLFVVGTLSPQPPSPHLAPHLVSMLAHLHSLLRGVARCRAALPTADLLLTTAVEHSQEQHASWRRLSASVAGWALRCLHTLHTGLASEWAVPLAAVPGLAGVIVTCTEDREATAAGLCCLQGALVEGTATAPLTLLGPGSYLALAALPALRSASAGHSGDDACTGLVLACLEALVPLMWWQGDFRTARKTLRHLSEDATLRRQQGVLGAHLAARQVGGVDNTPRHVTSRHDTARVTLGIVCSSGPVRSGHPLNPQPQPCSCPHTYGLCGCVPRRSSTPVGAT